VDPAVSALAPTAAPLTLTANRARDHLRRSYADYIAAFKDADRANQIKVKDGEDARGMLDEATTAHKLLEFKYSTQVAHRENGATECTPAEIRELRETHRLKLKAHYDLVCIRSMLEAMHAMDIFALHNIQSVCKSTINSVFDSIDEDLKNIHDTLEAAAATSPACAQKFRDQLITTMRDGNECAAICKHLPRRPRNWRILCLLAQVVTTAYVRALKCLAGNSFHPWVRERKLLVDLKAAIYQEPPFVELQQLDDEYKQHVIDQLWMAQPLPVGIPERMASEVLLAAYHPDLGDLGPICDVDILLADRRANLKYFRHEDM
jgi:hypothetical protein